MAREHLGRPERDFDVSGYVGLAAESPGVVEMLGAAQDERPAGGGEG